MLLLDLVIDVCYGRCYSLAERCRVKWNYGGDMKVGKSRARCLSFSPI